MSKQLDQALLLWLKYEVDCELFDRTLPGAFSQRDTDCWIPRDSRPMILHAIARRGELLQQCAVLGVPDGLIAEARRISDGWPMSRKAQVLNELETERTRSVT